MTARLLAAARARLHPLVAPGPLDILAEAASTAGLCAVLLFAAVAWGCQP